jgi:hypothetical protein
MKRLFTVLCIAASVGINVAGQSPSADHAKFQGVWRLVEETRPAVNQPTTPHRASLWIFTGKHHALVGEFYRDKPRPAIADSAKATIDELRANWDGMYMRAGTYEVEPGNVFVERNYAGKGVTDKQPGGWVRWSYKLEGDTLTVTNVRIHLNPVAPPNAGTWTFRKVIDNGEAGVSTGVAVVGPSDTFLTNIMGTWTLNVEKSTYNVGSSPKSSLTKWEPLANGFFKQAGPTVDAQGRTTYAETIGKFDGTDYPITGTGAAANTTRAYNPTDDRSMEVTVKTGGNPVATNRWLFSRDGKTITIMGTGKNAQGQPVVNNVTIWEKQ